MTGRIVNACVVLHNLCIEHNVPEVLDLYLPAEIDFEMYDMENNNQDIDRQEELIQI